LDCSYLVNAILSLLSTRLGKKDVRRERSEIEPLVGKEVASEQSKEEELVRCLDLELKVGSG
jgi:hypothetical protein